MNERIKELLKQSCGFEYDEDGNELTPILVGKDLAKFAELIVRECITICQHNADDDDDQFDLGRVHQAKEITHLIKKHLGVET